MSGEGMERPKLAFFFDCENIGLAEYDVSRVMQWAKFYGHPIIRRAYGDWSRSPKLKNELMAAAVELIDMPSDARGKNRADIRLVVDAMEVLYTRKHVDTFVIASGDSDFIPLLNRIRELGKRTLVLARRNNASNQLEAACDQLVFFDAFIKPTPEPVNARAASRVPDELLDRFYWVVHLLKQAKLSATHLGRLHNEMQLLFPGVKISQYGFSRSVGLRKVFSLMELDGFCRLEPTKKQNLAPWIIDFKPAFFERSVQVDKPSLYDQRLARLTSTKTLAPSASSSTTATSKKVSRSKPVPLPGPTIPNPYPVPSFADPAFAGFKELENKHGGSAASSGKSMFDWIDDFESTEQSWLDNDSDEVPF